MSTKTALVLEDNVLIRRILAVILAEVNVEAKTYSSPEEYRQKNGGCWCKHDPCPCYDFMLIDNRMPGMTGLEFLRKLEEGNCPLAGAHKAIISCDWKGRDWENALQKGYRVLKKPFKMADIRSWILETNTPISD